MQSFSVKADEVTQHVMNECLNALVECICNPDADTQGELLADLEAKCNEGIDRIITETRDAFEGLLNKDAALARESMAKELKKILDVLTVVAPVLVQNQAFDETDENLLALVDLLMEPGEAAKKLQAFETFKAKVFSHLRNMLQRKVIIFLGPLMSQKAFKDLLPAVLGQSGTNCEIVPASGHELQLAKLADIATTGVSMFGALERLAVEEFFVAETSADGGATTSKPLKTSWWLICYFPRCCELMGRAMEFLTKAAEVSQKNVPSFETFVKVATSLENDINSFRAALQALEIPDECEGLKLNVIQKVCGLMETCLKSCVGGVVGDFVTSLEQTQSSMRISMDSERLASVTSAVEEACDLESIRTHLQAAQSGESRSLHTALKVMDGYEDIIKALAPLKSICDEDLFQKVHVDQERVQKARSLNALLACIQALVRPLKADESRSALARRARVMIISRKSLGVEIPVCLDLLLTKVGADTSGGK